ncbi:MAG: hypothetical protein C0503_00280 [Gemmatimonas sp.]|nr:hypothetical protein [Gemmatimonas sp.]
MSVARSPELEFVTRLARRQPPAESVARARVLASAGLRWDRVEALADHHGLAALVHSTLSQVAIDLPRDVRRRLEASALQVATGNLAKFARWSALCSAFDAAGIRAVTMKGFHVVHSVYQDLGLRPVGDLDFLVAPEDVERSIQLLQEQDYWLVRRWSRAIANVGWRYALTRGHEVHLGAPDGLAVDLHWHAGPHGFALPTQELLRSAVPFTAQGVPALGADLPDLLAMLVAHGHKSRWHRFRWVVDVAEGLRLLDADGRERMRVHLQRLDLLPALSLVERIIAETWGPGDEASPVSVDGRDQGRRLRHILAVHERANDVNQTFDARRPLRLLRERLAERESPWEALRAAATPSHQDWAALRLPPALRFGYAAVRPVRVIRDALRTLGRERATTPFPARQITFVTAIYDNGPDSIVGGRGRGLDFFIPTLRVLSNLGAPLVVYCSRVHAERVTAALAPMFPRLMVRPFELSEFEFYRPFLEWKAEYRDELPNNFRNEVLCFLKAYWLHAVSQERPWEHDLTFWIDAGLFHHGIFPERFGGMELLKPADAWRMFPKYPDAIVRPALLDGLVAATPPGKMFFCALPMLGSGPHHDGYRRLARNGGGTGALVNHLVGGIFGGDSESIDAFQREFRNLVARAITERIYTLEEQLFSVMYDRHPETFAVQHFGTWHFYSPGEPCSYLSQEGDSFYKVFARLAGVRTA